MAGVFRLSAPSLPRLSRKDVDAATWEGRARCNEIGSSLHRHAVPDLIRGLSRASTSFLRHLSKPNVDGPRIKSGGDKPGHDAAKVTQRDRNAF